MFAGFDNWKLQPASQQSDVVIVESIVAFWFYLIFCQPPSESATDSSRSSLIYAPLKCPSSKYIQQQQWQTNNEGNVDWSLATNDLATAIIVWSWQADRRRILASWSFVLC